MRTFVKTFLVLGLLMAGGIAAADTPATRRPNVIFILADDLGIGDLGCYGQKRIQTPNIDRMAADGIRFTQAYSGTSVCAPSRCTLMTGLHTGHCYIRANKEIKPEGQEPMPADTFTVAKLMKQAGYTTGIIGKWGLGGPDAASEPNKMGFDYFYGYVCQRKAHEYYPEYLWRNTEKVMLDGKTYSHDLLTEEALAFVKKNQSQPFFLYLPYTIPHGKYQVPSDAPYTNESWPTTMKAYAAMITRMDKDIGRLFGLLKELGIDNNTLVFFTSDNGVSEPLKTKEGSDFFQSAGPFRGRKRDLYEGGLRAPMLARWPGTIKPGTDSSLIWAFWDFLPTMAELTGTALPVKSDGISILPTLRGQTQPDREHLYWEFYEGGYKQAVRLGDWKAVRIAAKGVTELYDLKSDESEKTDLAAKHPEIVQKAEAIMKTEHIDSQIWSTKPVEAGKSKGKGEKKPPSER